MRRTTVGGRVRAVMAVVALAAVAASAGPMPADAVVSEWPQFRAGPARTGSTSPSNIALANVAGLAPAWHSSGLGAGVSSPAVVGGVVYAGSSDHNLYAIPAAGGAPLWRGTTGAGIASSPAVAAGVVYVGSLDHSLYAFDGATGCSGTPVTCAPRWTATTGEAINSSPAVAEGVVYVGSDDDKLHAFDAVTGTPLWTATTGGDVFSSPAVSGGKVYVGSDDGKLYAFDAAGTTNCSGSPKTCTALWTATTGSFVQSSPAVAGGVVYVGSVDGKLYAFDAAGGTTLWTATTGALISSPAVAAGVVYVGSFDKKLYAFDAGGATNCSGVPKTCMPLWTAATSATDLVISSPAVANGVVFVGSGSADHRLYAFDAAGVTNCSGSPRTCAPVWTGDTGSGVRSSPAVAGNMVYAGTDGEAVVAFGLLPEGRFHGLAPARILDTRLGVGAPAAKVGPAGTLAVQVTGRGGVPASGVSAVVLNVTVTEPTAGGWLTAWPAGQARPLASNLNFAPGQTVPNLVVVKVGAAGQVDLYNSSGSTHVIADVSGWFGTDVAEGGSRYSTVSPARILDTRLGLGAPAAKVGPAGTLAVQVTGQGGVPATGVSAVVLNVTVTEPTVDGWVTAWPAGQPRPLASNLNFVAGQTVPNLVVVRVGDGGIVDLYNSGGMTHLLADVEGWYGADGAATGSRYTSLPPARILDTRLGLGGPAAKVGAGGTRDLQVVGEGGVPVTGVSAVVLNVTVTEPTAESWVTVWPAGQARPLASNLNFVAGQTVPNLVMVSVGADGRVTLYNDAGATDLIVDVAGWYAG